MDFTKFYLKVMVYDSQVERLYIICDRTYRLKKAIKNKFTQKYLTDASCTTEIISKNFSNF